MTRDEALRGLATQLDVIAGRGAGFMRADDAASRIRTILALPEEPCVVQEAQRQWTDLAIAMIAELRMDYPPSAPAVKRWYRCTKCHRLLTESETFTNVIGLAHREECCNPCGPVVAAPAEGKRE